MKRQAQAKLRAEYEAQKDEFDNYVDFLNWKADHSELARLIRQKIASAQADGRRG
jgi:hypothetical protein